MSLKGNIFLRGVYIFVKSFFMIKRRNFGYCADNVVITPPIFKVIKEMYFFMIILHWRLIRGYRLQMQSLLSNPIALLQRV